MTTAMTRATIAIVRVSMARPYSVSRAVSPDPPSGTPLPLKTDWGRLERVLAGSRPDEDQASASAPSTPSSLLHLWKGSSAAVAAEFHATGHCSAASTISTRASSRTSASASGGRRAERMIPADEGVLRAHVRLRQACHVRPDAWRVGDRELMDELDRERVARSSRSLLDGLGEPVAGVIRAARRRHAPALPWLFVWRSPTARVVCRSTFDRSNGLERGGSASRIGPDPRNLRNACAWVRAKMQQGARPRASTVRFT
jgi:hypothetical protein